ncbi:acyltransferase [Puia sp.]|jgi:peptidoglycan/LPS O-acetylase OafA/YrhL|uniref:acyltransferase family protein n=1 Tax=Puia sp. TaxID=2045100 RepID=UPI002F3F57BA
MKAYLPTLTPLRGVAAVLVVLFHSQVFIYPVVDRRVTLLVEKGWLWVDFFFVLSGFILCYVYGEGFRKRVTKAGYSQYLRARFARVYPLHFFTLFWALGAGALILSQPIAHPDWSRFFHFIFDVHTVPASLVLLQAMHLFPTSPLNTVSWSLSTEWWMYMLFPFLAPLLWRVPQGGENGRSGRVRSGLWLLVVVGLYAGVKYFLVPKFGMHAWKRQDATLNTINDFAFVRCMAGFLLGMLVCRWYQLSLAQRWLQRNASFGIIGLALLISLHFEANELITVAIFPLLILAAVYNRSAVSRWLATSPMQRLGDWSFSIYMVHMPVFFTYRGVAPFLGLPVPEGFFTQAPNYWKGWIAFALFLAATLGFSALCYRYLEVPARNFLNRGRVKVTRYAAP